MTTEEQTPSAAPADFDRLVRRGKLITLHMYGGLLALYALLFYLNAEHKDALAWWLMQSVPLLIFIPGLINNHYKTYSWLCFVSLIYFTAVVPLVMSPNAGWHHWLQLVLIVALFISAMMTSRWRQRQMINNCEI